MDCSKCKHYREDGCCQPSHCANFEPKEKSEPLYTVDDGKEYQWTGIASEVGQQSKPTKVELKDRMFSYRHIWQYMIDISPRWWVDESELKPLLSEHKEGEKFNEDWEYAGNLRIPNPEKDTWGYKGNIFGIGGLNCFPYLGTDNGFREILRPRKKEAEPTLRLCFHCGDFHTNLKNIPCVTCFNDYNRPNFRPKEEADKWTRQVGGLRVRAYRDQQNDIWFVGSNGAEIPSVNGRKRELYEAICKALDIPIMRWSESHGNFMKP